MHVKIKNEHITTSRISRGLTQTESRNAGNSVKAAGESTIERRLASCMCVSSFL